MKNSEGLHTDRYYEMLADRGVLISEEVSGTDEDGELETYYGFDDAVEEAEYEDVQLDQYGEAYFYQESVFYQCIIHMESNECTAVNMLEPIEVKELAANQLDLHHGDEAELLEAFPFFKEYINT